MPAVAPLIRVEYLHRKLPDAAGTLIHQRPVVFGIVDSPGFRVLNQ